MACKPSKKGQHFQSSTKYLEQNISNYNISQIHYENIFYDESTNIDLVVRVFIFLYIFCQIKKVLTFLLNLYAAYLGQGVYGLLVFRGIDILLIS